MPFTTITTITTLLTPDDADVPQLLAHLIDGATTSVRFIIYGATLPAFFDALVRAHERGCNVKGIFDHSQASGPKERRALDALFETVPCEHFRIGTSPKAHQIVHLKGLWVNWKEGDTEPAGHQYATWEDALKDAYPVVWSGSWNYSESATSQINNVDIMPGILRAQAFQRAFDELWVYIDTHEKQYQPIPKESA